ncbi:hypothetical protein LJE86_08090 [bacterium BMS3Abin03]|nr:hypothetical protein [bacterium BMS3Abin03]
MLWNIVSIITNYVTNRIMATENKFVELVCDMGLDERLDLDYKIKNDKVLISLPHCTKNLILSENNVDELYDGNKITEIRNLVYYPDCGFSFDAYCEFFINLTHPDYYFYNWDEGWPNEGKLTFKIDEDIIECADSSSLAVLLLSQIYYDPDIYPDRLQNFSTLKIFRHSKEDFRDIFNKAIYYLNSHYLANTGVTVTLKHLSSGTDDYEYYKLEEKLEKLSRKRIRKRKNFLTTDPLKLYNYACSLKGENQFLAFYRVLEFFFDRFKNKTVSEKRFDVNFPDAELIKVASLKGELEHLIGLLNTVSTSSVRSKLGKYALHKGLIKSKNFDELATQLYFYRNSIVHAKESQIERTAIPDPFDIEQTILINNWIYITRIFADLVINYYNKV